MAAFRLLLVCCVLLVFSMSSASLPEPGKLKLVFSKYDNFLGFPKALYKGATIYVKGKCSSTEKISPKITITWRLKYTQCADYFATATSPDVFAYLWDKSRRYEINGEDTVSCDNKFIHLADQSAQEEYIPPDNETEANAAESKTEVDEDNNTKKREEQAKPHEENKGADAAKETEKKKVKKVSNQLNADNKRKESNVDHNKVSQDTTKKHQVTSNANPNSASEKKRRSAEMKDMLKTLVRVKRETDKEDSNSGASKTKKGKEKKQIVPSNKSQKNKDDGNAGENDNTAAASHDKKEKKPKAVAKKASSKGTEEKKPKEIGKKPSPKGTKKSSVIAKANRDGIYLLIVTVRPADQDEAGNDKPEFNLELDVAMESKSGYLSATDWPLLPFYGVMSLVYLFYGIIWLIVSACQWRDLLRIQFWIGGVIALGMLEKAVFYSEYNNINNTGITTPSLVVFAEIVSVAKRTLARMLVIIVSMGFGIVKPRLGKSLHRVLGVGALYFIIGIVEGCLRSLSLKADPSKEQLIAGIPLAVLDAAICWWIFMSLVQTTRTLRIRRNVIKLSLYRHFTNTLIFAVLASVAYMIWSIKTHKFADCMKDWSELWLDDAFWHFLFSIILLVIMILWRPTANNQRYAFTPIVDFDDDDEDNVTLSEAFEGMKMRNTRTEVIVPGDSKKKAEDDLKWVEENIPSSAADTVLPSVLDSDEELMTTKFEMSKME